MDVRGTSRFPVPNETTDNRDELFSIEPVQLDGQAVMRLSGELDLSTRHRLDRLLEDLQAITGTTVILDLARLTFVDAHSLHAWREAAVALQEHGGELVLRNPRPLVRRLLDITEVVEVARIDPEFPPSAR
jgi:anti-sigma B factor antagonist